MYAEAECGIVGGRKDKFSFGHSGAVLVTNVDLVGQKQLNPPLCRLCSLGDSDVKSLDSVILNFQVSMDSILQNNPDGILVALNFTKRLHPAHMKSVIKTETLAQVSRLMVQLLQLQHTNVLQYALCIPNRCASQPEVLLATPLCECNLGELLVLLKADGSLGQRAHGLVRQLLSGLHYLHTLSTPVVHGNLKPSNVLIDDKGVVRLAEFGLHQMLYQTTPPPASSVIWWSCETCVAYEQNRRMSCSTMSDIQVAGMVVHFILTGGNHPFGTEASQIVQNIRRGFNAPATTNCEANDLISWMVLQNPGQRPSIEKVIRHIYFWDTEKKWKFLLTCAGMSPDCKTAPLPLSNFFPCLEKQAAYHNTKGDWVSVVRTFLPEIAPSVVSYSNTPVGLLNFMRDCLNSMQNMDIQTTMRLQQFFVAAFPGLSLTLYRFIEKTDWLRHPALAPFVDGTNY